MADATIQLQPERLTRRLHQQEEQAMRRYLLIAGALGLMALTGCGGYRYDGYYASAPPPPMRAEYYGPAPSPYHVWTNGYWGYGNGRYQWSPGRWARPPHRGARWEQGRWNRDGRGWRYERGQWR